MTVYTPLEESIYSRLSTDSNITDELGGTYIYNTVASRLAPSDLIIFNRQSGENENLDSGVIRDVIYQFRATSYDHAKAVTLSDLMDTALHRVALTVSGWTCHKMDRESDVVSSELDSYSRTIFHEGFLVRMLLEKPTN